MLALENADEILQILDRFTKQKSKDIPAELEEYINYVAKTGDTVYRWPTVQYLFREKLRNVIKDFHDTTASIEDLPQCPNVDQFNYESMKTLLFERFDNFQAAPFTIQRLCELLTDPKKHYSRLDKFMRALEKNILVVSTVLPGRKPTEESPDNCIDPILPGIKIDDMKSDEKRYGNDNHTEQNGPTENHIEVNSKEHTPTEVAPSGSTSHASSENDAKTDDEDTTVDEPMPDKSVEVEKPTPDAEQPVAEKEAEKTSDPVEPAETKPVEAAEEASTDKMESDTPKAESTVDAAKVDAIETAQKEVEPKEEAIETVQSEEKKIDEEVKETPASVEPVVTEKPSTPKRACISDDEDDVTENGTSNHNAKKIRLELNEDEKAETKPATEPAAEVAIVAETDVQEQKEQNAKNDEIDALKEKELLLDAVDSALPVEKDSINVDDKPSEAKAIESESSQITDEIPAADTAVKPDEPVTASIAADLDFTPDEALNELVSSEILAVIPEQPVEEVKMNEETPAIVAEAAAAATATTDEMTVENNETNTVEAENAMEAAPIKTDEEQMDVDESNSVDAMDL